jgi:hypothetical protein
VLALDTNVLLDSSNRDSKFHAPCERLLSKWRRDSTDVFLTWNVCYEFMRVTTHARYLRSPWSPRQAWQFLEALLRSPGFEMLTAPPGHAAVLAETLEDVPEARGNLIHDLHTAVLMREHGVRRICTRDRDFGRFPFLEVVDPLEV